MKVLITGADGMLGSSICRETLDQGYQVRVFVLPNSPCKTLENLPVEIFYGNLLDENSMEKAIEGCDAVINVAASTQIWPRRSPVIHKINYDGVVSMVNLAKKKTYGGLFKLARPTRLAMVDLRIRELRSPLLWEKVTKWTMLIASTKPNSFY